MNKRAILKSDNSLSITLLFFLIGSLFVPIEPLFLLALSFLGFQIIIAKNKSIYTNSFSVLYLISIILIIGILSNSELTNGRDYFRDIYIFFKIIVLFLLGVYYSTITKSIEHIFKYLKYSSLIYSIVHLFKFILSYTGTLNLDSLRWAAGTDSFLEAVFIGLVLARLLKKDFNLKFKQYTSTDRVIIAIISLSFLLYFSRTMIISALIITAFSSGWISGRELFSRKNLNLLRIIIAIFLIQSLLSFLVASDYITSGILKTLVNKIENIPDEIFWSSTRNATASLGDINVNWRGYEAYQGMMLFFSGDNWEKTFGHGWGTLVDLGLTINLGGKDFERVPVLHNGYVYLLVKAGVIGMVLYLVFLYKLGFSKKKTSLLSESTTVYTDLLTGMCLLLVINTFTIAGLLGGEIVKPFFLGFLWAMAQKKFRKNAPSKFNIAIT